MTAKVVYFTIILGCGTGLLQPKKLEESMKFVGCSDLEDSVYKNNQKKKNYGTNSLASTLNLNDGTNSVALTFSGAGSLGLTT